MVERYRRKLMKNFNVIFAGCARNVEKCIKTNLDHINACGAKFKSFQLIIYENDSTDNTRTILNEAKKDNYHYIFEDNVTEPARTMCLAHGRNQLIAKMRELDTYGVYHYLIMMDLDNINSSGSFIDSIETCFDYETDDWDVLTANQTGGYYDLWALRYSEIIDGDFWKDKYYKEEIEETQRIIIVPQLILPQDTLIEVDSAFGGIAIYKISSIPEDAKYVGKYPDDKPYDHVCPMLFLNMQVKMLQSKIFRIITKNANMSIFTNLSEIMAAEYLSTPILLTVQ